MTYETLLDHLREVPPVGAWAVLTSSWHEEEQDWLPDGTRPDDWHHTREQAEAS